MLLVFLPPPRGSVPMRSAARKQLLKVPRHRKNLATLLARIAEIDHRGLYEESGYATTVHYFAHQYGMCETHARLYVEVARTARQFPILFEAIARGRLHLEAVQVLAPYLTEDNVAELVAAMTRRPESEIRAMLAEWFPRPRAG